MKLKLKNSLFPRLFLVCPSHAIHQCTHRHVGFESGGGGGGRGCRLNPNLRKGGSQEFETTIPRLVLTSGGRGNSHLIYFIFLL